MGIWYATRERVTRSSEVAATAYASSLVDEKIDAGSRAVEGLLHRRFYPVRTTRSFDWPNRSGAPVWDLWLEGNELISVESIVAGGTTLDASDFFLRRDDDVDEPPYTKIQIDLTTGAAFRSGQSWQMAISVLGLWGFNDTSTAVAAASLGVSVNSSTNTVVLNPSGGRLDVGVGSIVLIGTERLILTERTLRDTGINTAGTLSSQQNARLLAVSDGASFAVGETILVDAERMRIDDIAGNNLIVSRAWGGSTLDDHASGVDVYALRSFTAERGALGTDEASHTAGDAVYVHKFPGLVSELAAAESVVLLEQGSAGYARTVGSGPNQRESAGKGLEDLRASAYAAYGRKLRSAAI